MSGYSNLRKKKTKMTDKLLPIDSELRTINNSNYKFYEKLDVMWVLSHHLKIANTPMWVGFNSKIVVDESMKQKVSYLTPINASPTNISVVYETMRQSQRIAEELQQQYIEVTYDLAIAKVAYQIQSAEHPQLSNLFIHLGAFHIMMAYFKAVGKFINECGLTYIMVESGLLASGSVNGFISGKHFNRCKRLHPLVSLGLQVLLFEDFVTKQNISIEVSVTSKITNATLEKLLEDFLDYKKKALNGDFGKTPQYYVNYINFVDYYLMFTRSIRIGDFALFKEVIPKMANLFFMFNQGNYSRWLLKYHDNLLKVEETHPDLGIQFKNGYFGVKRTNKKFSRSPVDLTLEQTVNADAARRLTGVTHFTNSINARQRWSKSHSIRSTLISYTYEEIGLKKAQDITGDVEKHQIKKDSVQLQNFIKLLKQNFNTFNSESIESNFLYNIATGRAASEEVTNFLLKAEQNGNALREKFISECVESGDRFEATIKQNKILNFANSTAKKKIQINNKVQ
ncbi:uncharacterized protein LOC116417096 isoform X1 [Nasonia vitripennis]|uniref:Uncharacterized protein n=1 Tax=Nasonia vitripennis TaxID=7425 RepID=A0A7M7R5I1_NASVI|nr:uncharacterized protein LOC116417096 isoform X1 [Nasonia vitripennis]